MAGAYQKTPVFTRAYRKKIFGLPIYPLGGKCVPHAHVHVGLGGLEQDDGTAAPQVERVTGGRARSLYVGVLPQVGGGVDAPDGAAVEAGVDNAVRDSRAQGLVAVVGENVSKGALCGGHATTLPTKPRRVKPLPPRG